MIQDEMPLEDLTTPSQETIDQPAPPDAAPAQWPVVEVMDFAPEPEIPAPVYHEPAPDIYPEIVPSLPQETLPEPTPISEITAPIPQEIAPDPDPESQPPIAAAIPPEISPPPAEEPESPIIVPEPLLFSAPEPFIPVTPTPEPQIETFDTIETPDAPPAPPAFPTASEPPILTAPADFTIRGGWTISLLLIGIGIIATCILIPQGDQTRKLMYEREKLRGDLAQIQKQVTTNSDFLQKVSTDPTLAERLAQRQMKLLPAGTRVLNVDMQTTSNDSSPFLLVSVPPPPPMPSYQPRGGIIAQTCRNERGQLYLMGAGLMFAAAGLVLGGVEKK